MQVNVELCQKCLECMKICPVQAISEGSESIEIDKDVCLNCGCCAAVCPHKAINFD